MHERCILCYPPFSIANRDGPFFGTLLKLIRDLTEEETRHVRENLSEKGLTIFGLLTRPDKKPSLQQGVPVLSRELARRTLPALPPNPLRSRPDGVSDGRGGRNTRLVRVLAYRSTPSNCVRALCSPSRHIRSMIATARR